MKSIVNKNLINQYAKFILAAVTKFDATLVKRIEKKGFKIDFIAEINAVAYELSSKKDEFDYEAALEQAKYIKSFAYKICPRVPFRNVPAQLTHRDKMNINSIETLYIAGGAAWVYELLPNHETYKNQIRKLLSACFRSARNELRNSELRKIFNRLVEEGYSPRLSGEGSLYLELGKKKVRISDHEATDWFVYNDITEDYIY
jgi:hypothetical protein